MPISGNKWDLLSLQLVAGMENFVRGFFIDKKISQKEIPEVVDCNILNRFVQDLGLKVRVEKFVEMSVTAAVAKETPLEIIDRIVTKVANNEIANSYLSPCGNRGSPKIVL